MVRQYLRFAYKGEKIQAKAKRNTKLIIKSAIAIHIKSGCVIIILSIILIVSFAGALLYN